MLYLGLLAVLNLLLLPAQDIDGGMNVDIYDSMATAVDGAAVVITFMSQRYQDSVNCKLELKVRSSLLMWFVAAAAAASGAIIATVECVG